MPAPGDLTPTMRELVGVDWAAGDDRSVHAIITNNTVEPIFELKTTGDIDAALREAQIAFYKASCVPPEWFVHEGTLYRNTKEGIVTYAFNP